MLALQVYSLPQGKCYSFIPELREILRGLGFLAQLKSRLQQESCIRSKFPFIMRRFARVVATSIFLLGILGCIVTITISEPILKKMFFFISGSLLIAIGAWLFKVADKVLERSKISLVGDGFALGIEFLFEAFFLINIVLFIGGFNCVRPLPWMKYDIEGFGACETTGMDCCADGFFQIKAACICAIACLALYSAYWHRSKQKCTHGNAHLLSSR